ncbi:MAG: hypothetical protein QW128_07335 [Thermoprotei archaeon]
MEEYKLNGDSSPRLTVKNIKEMMKNKTEGRKNEVKKRDRGDESPIYREMVNL